jgi:hypothetical protein
MPECVTCVSLHGPPGCPASSITADGDPICIFCIDQLLCPVQKRMLANVRSPLHSPKRFAIAHLLQGENLPRAQAQDAREAAPAKPKTNGHDPTSAHNATSPHNGAARNLQMRALRAAAAPPAKPKSSGHAAAPTHSSSNAAAHRPHARAEKPPAGLPQKPALASRSLGAAARNSVPTNSVQVTTSEPNQEDPKMTSTSTTSAPAPAARLCQHPKCTRELSAANRSGYCVAHRDQHRDRRRISSNGHNGARDARAPAAKSNGSGKTNGHEDRLIARRVKALLGAVELPVDVVLEIIPDEDKKIFVENWLLAREGAA